jgi:hypothetical protein
VYNKTRKGKKKKGYETLKQASEWLEKYQAEIDQELALMV